MRGIISAGKGTRNVMEKKGHMAESDHCGMQRPGPGALSLRVSVESG